MIAGDSRCWPARIFGLKVSQRSSLDLDDHYQIVQTVSAPAAQPAHLPAAEEGAYLNGGAQAEEFGFELHG